MSANITSTGDPKICTASKSKKSRTESKTKYVVTKYSNNDMGLLHEVVIASELSFFPKPAKNEIVFTDWIEEEGRLISDSSRIEER
jgi:hypothetical protein